MCLLCHTCSVPMTRTRSRNDKDKDVPTGAGGGGQPHWTLSSGAGHPSGAAGQDYHRSSNGPHQSRQGTGCRWDIKFVACVLVGYLISRGQIICV